MRIEVREFEHVPAEIWASLETELAPEQRFLAYNWLPSWSKTQLPRKRWRGPMRYLVAFGPSDQPLGVVPLARQQYGPLRIPALGGYYFPFRGLPFARDHEADVARAVVAVLRSNRLRVLRVGPMLRTHASVSALADALRADGWALMVKPRGVEFAMDLPDSVERFRSEMSSHLRKGIGNRQRRMQRQCATRLERYTGLAPDAWKPVLQDLAAIERASWVGKSNGFLHFVDPDNAAFWQSCLDVPQMSAATCALVLYLDGAPSAFDFWVDSGPVRYFIAGLHDERAAAHSPGSYLLQIMLEDAIERGLGRASLGQGDSGYKTRFGAKAAGQIDDWIAMPPGVVGRGVEALWKARERISSRRRTVAAATDSKSPEAERG